MKNFFSRGMFVDVMSVHNRNMKHAREIEFTSYVIMVVVDQSLVCLASTGQNTFTLLVFTFVPRLRLAHGGSSRC